ncbi:MAG: hypothetical protein HUJ98_13720 [Bacteroidaceae bacterium]|nr:hypothetical protein [Bacteroidaceae bacterium]
MVKVSIRDYMPPYTKWMQVELEDGVCNASPKMEQTAEISTESHQGNSEFEFELPKQQGQSDTSWD